MSVESDESFEIPQFLLEPLDFDAQESFPKGNTFPVSEENIDSIHGKSESYRGLPSVPPYLSQFGKDWIGSRITAGRFILVALVVAATAAYAGSNLFGSYFAKRLNSGADLISPALAASPPNQDSDATPSDWSTQAARLELPPVPTATPKEPDVAPAAAANALAAPAGNAVPPPASTQADGASGSLGPIADSSTPALGAVAAEVAVHGLNDREIRFGMASPFTGPNREAGRQLKLGVDAAFSEANDAGGVAGRQLRLITADDGYEPARTAAVMTDLYGKQDVFGFIGNFGSATAAVSLPFVLEKKALFLGALSGAGLLRRDPPDRYVFNYRPSYAEETGAAVRYLVKVRRIAPKDIAVFSQDDAFGDAGYEGVAKAMRALPNGADETLRLNYKRNTIDVDAAVAQLRTTKGRAKAIVMVATYRAAAKFIEKTRDLYPSLIYTNVSAVGSTSLADELMLLGPHFAEGVVVTQDTPAVGSSASVVLKYKSALNKYFPGEAPDYTSFEAYIDASILIEALKRAGRQVDSERLVDAFEAMRNLDLGLGTPLHFSANEHQGSHKVWGTQLDASGHYQPIDLE